jgi:hypothetical protein
MKMRFILLAVAGILAFTGCKEDEVTEGKLRLTAKAYQGDETLVMGDVYTDPFDRPMFVEQFRAYVSNVYAINENNEEIKLFTVDQINFNGSWAREFTLPAGKYKGIKVGLGVPAEFNTDVDPASYPNDHPLSINGAEGMFWTWASGYIFVKYEGKVALDGDASSILDPYAFHVGGDMFYETVTFTQPFEIDEARSNLELVFKADQFLQNGNDVIDLAEDNLTHTMDNMPLANRFMELFTNAIVAR